MIRFDPKKHILDGLRRVHLRQAQVRGKIQRLVEQGLGLGAAFGLGRVNHAQVFAGENALLARRGSRIALEEKLQAFAHRVEFAVTVDFLDAVHVQRLGAEGGAKKRQKKQKPSSGHGREKVKSFKDTRLDTANLSFY